MKHSNISFCGFCDSFPESYRNNFSYEGKKALFDYIEQYEEDCNTEVELDIIALCCEYNEYKDIKEYVDCYKPDINKDDYSDNEAYEYAIFEHIRNNTTLILIEDSDRFIIRCY